MESNSLVKASPLPSLKGQGCSDAWAHQGSIGSWRATLANHGLSEDGSIARMGADSTWKQALEYLQRSSFRSIQSAPAFSVAGSISANIHGRDTAFPMLKDQLERMAIALPSREVVEATPDNEYSDLFHAVIGGMGRVARIESADIKLTPNVALKAETHRVSTERITEQIQASGAQMAHVMPHPKGEQAVLKTYSPQYSNGGASTLTDMKRYGKRKLRGDIGLQFLNGLAKVKRLDSARWHLTRHCCYQIRKPKVRSRNNSFSTFSRPRLKSFRIAEYFVHGSQYGQFVRDIHRAQREVGAPVLFAGSRLVFEGKPSAENCLSFSRGMERDSPWMSLVVNYCCSRQKEEALLGGAILPVLRHHGARFHLPYGMATILNDRELAEFFPQLPNWIETKRKYTE